MSRLITVGSGSSGNAYILESCGQILLIECGVSWDKKLLPALNFKEGLEKVAGCIVSHR
jgi:hypothetical protein